MNMAGAPQGKRRPMEDPMGATEEMVMLIFSLAAIAPFSYLLIRFLGSIFTEIATTWRTASRRGANARE